MLSDFFIPGTHRVNKGECSIKKSIGRPASVPASVPVSQPVSQPVRQPVSWVVGQSINLSVSTPVGWSVNQSLSLWETSFLHNESMLFSLSSLDQRWYSYIRNYIRGWREHTQFWLTEESRPVRPLIYADLVENVPEQLPMLLQYFGVVLDKSTMQRYCCVMEHSLNKGIKRSWSPIEEFKVRVRSSVEKWVV